MSNKKEHSNLDYLFDKGLDLEKRRVFLHSEIEGSTTLRETYESSSSDSPIEDVIRSLLYLDQSKGRIELFINSPGGHVSEALGLYDIIQNLDNPVKTVGFGEICSAAGLILVCGDERTATANSFFMSHLPSAEIEGDPYTIGDTFEYFKRLDDKWNTLMANHTKHSKRWWENLHKGAKRELYLDSKQMIRHGIIDKIYGED